MKQPLLRKWTAALVVLLPVLASALAQNSSDRAGIALVKPQAWSNDSQATVLEFLDFADHTGYYEFRTSRSPKYQVATSKIVKLVIFPQAQSSLSSAGERAALQSVIDDFAALSARFPSAARQLNAAAAILKADAAKYDAGNVKQDGSWVTRSAYSNQKAQELANLVRPELIAEPNIRDIDLSTNQYYVGLQELAKSDPSVKPVVDGVRSLYQSLVRKADRDDLLNQLNSPTLGFDEASALVSKLKALQPGEDARASLFVKSWDAAVAKAGELRKMITDVQTQFEAAMPAAGDEVPEIPKELTATVDKVSAAARSFRAGSPPSAIQVPLQLSDSMVAVAAKLPGVAKQIGARELLDAKATLDALSNQADVIGIRTAKIIAALQKKLTTDIEKFQALRNEAKMLAENDKIEGAIKKYQAAFAIIPAKDVSAQIDILKKQ